MYAVIRTGGKQYRVEAGQRLRVEKLPGVAGDSVAFPDVLMIGGGNGQVAVGTPVVENAKVVGEIVEQGRSRKVTVFKYKNKTRYRRLRGHRQQLTLLAITEIQAPDGRSDTYELRRPSQALEEVEEPEAAAIVTVDADAAEASEPAAASAPAEETTSAAADGDAAPSVAAEAGDAVAEPRTTARKLASRGRKTASKAGTKASAAKKTAAKKTTAKKTTAAKKTAAKKTTTARKTAAKKTGAAKRAPARKAKKEE